MMHAPRQTLAIQLQVSLCNPAGHERLLEGRYVIHVCPVDRVNTLLHMLSGNIQQIYAPACLRFT